MCLCVISWLSACQLFSAYYSCSLFLSLFFMAFFFTFFFCQKYFGLITFNDSFFIFFVGLSSITLLFFFSLGSWFQVYNTVLWFTIVCHQAALYHNYQSLTLVYFHFSPPSLWYPLQYSCLENPRDRGAWWAAVYGVAQSRTRLKRLSSSSSSLWVIVVIHYTITYITITTSCCYVYLNNYFKVTSVLSM